MEALSVTPNRFVVVGLLYIYYLFSVFDMFSVRIAFPKKTKLTDAFLYVRGGSFGLLYYIHSAEFPFRLYYVHMRTSNILT